MLKICLLLLLLFSSLLSQDDENSYQLGDGIQVASLPVYIGGYISSDYTNKASTNQYRVDDVAFLSYGNYKKLSYMLELEFKEFYTVIETPQQTVIKADRRVHTERLYVDYQYNENLLLKFGKSNTPIGYWNLLPVNVLRDTTSNPITNSILYPTFSTGLITSYNSYIGSGSEFQIDVIIQKNDDIDSNYNNYITDEHYGIGLSYAKDDISFKVNAGIFHDIVDDREQKYYFLFSSRYETDAYQFTTELGAQSSTEGVTTEYAAYSQLVYYIKEQHSTILRLESYNDKLKNKRDNIAIFAYTYRPLYPIAIKSEYQIHSKAKDNTFLFSFSVMF